MNGDVTNPTMASVENLVENDRMGESGDKKAPWEALQLGCF